MSIRLKKTKKKQEIIPNEDLKKPIEVVDVAQENVPKDSLKVEEVKIKELVEPIEQPVTPVSPTIADLSAPIKKTKHKKLRIFLISLTLFIVLLLILLGAGVAYFLPHLTSIKNSVDKIQLEASAFKQDLFSKDFSQLTTRMTNIDVELLNIKKELDTFDFMQDVGFLSPYYKNIGVTKEILTNTDILINKAKPKVEVFVNDLQTAISSRTVDDSQNTQETNIENPNEKLVQPVVISNEEKCAVQLKDNADLKILGLDSEKLATDKKSQSGDGNTKIRDMISVLPEGIDIYNEIEPEILTLIQSINKLDVEALPSFTPQKYIDSLKSVLETTRSAEANFQQYTQLVKRILTGLPDLLGSKKPVTYLVIFQNEKELRASGGLLTAYGVITVDKGKVIGEIVTRDMWDLQADVWKYGGNKYVNIYGQRVLMEDGCGGTELRSQDSGIYPDLQVSMQTFLTYYDNLMLKSPNKYPVYDNVIILNTFFASDMVSLVEPLIMDDCQVITGANLAKTIFADRNDNVGRKANIGTIAKAAEGQFSSIPSSKLTSVADTLIKTIEAKNVAMYSKDPVMQAYFEGLGMTGKIIKDYPGDYFHLNEAQVCGLKANFYLYDKVTQNISISDNGSVSKAVQVFWQMDKVWEASEDEIMSNSPRFPYRAWIRFMTPQGTSFTGTDGLVKSRGLYTPVTYFDSIMQKQVSDNVIWFNHLRRTAEQSSPTFDLNVSYNLPTLASYDEINGYKMLVQKHPGKKDEKYVINLTYKGVTNTVEFLLDRDKVVSYKSGILSVDNYEHPLDDYSKLLNSVLPAN